MPRPRILVVEDDAKLREILKGALESGYDILLAKDGQEALTLARTFRPDVILLDLQLPRLGGLDVLKVLKMSAETIPIPVVVLSALEGSCSLLDAGALGAQEYLLKPTPLTEVRDAIQRQLFRSKVRLVADEPG